MDETYKNWLDKAEDDLKWTKSNLREEIWYGACFTAHQSVEKSLKSFLLKNGKVVAKIHDISALAERCKEIDPDFDKLIEDVLKIADYYVQTRYPDMSDFMEYTENKAKEAYEIAKEVFEFVKEKV